MEKKKVVVFGGGTSMSKLLMGLKEFPLDITSVVAVSDDGKSTGRLREEFGIPGVGDTNKVLVALSETEPLVEKLFRYRFDTTSDLDGHAVGNLLLTAMTNITGSLSTGIESLSKVLNLKGKVIPLTDDNAVLGAKMHDGTKIIGEASITADKRKIKEVFYIKDPHINKRVLKEIKSANTIILSMGSVWTSIIPNLLCPEVIKAIDSSKAQIIYVCNIMTQPGETDNFNVTDHCNTLNKYLGKKKISVVLANNGKVSKEMIKRYYVKEQKDPVKIDKTIKNNKNIKFIENDYVFVDKKNNFLRHDVLKLAIDIYSHIMFK